MEKPSSCDICKIVFLYVILYLGILFVVLLYSDLKKTHLKPVHIWFESNLVNFEIPEDLTIFLGSF